LKKWGTPLILLLGVGAVIGLIVWVEVVANPTVFNLLNRTGSEVEIVHVARLDQPDTWDVPEPNILAPRRTVSDGTSKEAFITHGFDIRMIVQAGDCQAVYEIAPQGKILMAELAPDLGLYWRDNFPFWSWALHRDEAPPSQPDGFPIFPAHVTGCAWTRPSAS